MVVVVVVVSEYMLLYDLIVPSRCTATTVIVILHSFITVRMIELYFGDNCIIFLQMRQIPEDDRHTMFLPFLFDNRRFTLL